MKPFRGKALVEIDGEPAIAVVRRLTGLGQNQAKRLFELGKVQLDGRECTSWSVQPRLGQTVDVDTNRRRPGRRPGLSDDALRYCDDTLVVVEKPSGVVSVPPTRTGEPTLLDLVRDRLGGPLGQHLVPIHRLDFGTSGLMLFAFRGPDLEKMSALVATHQLDRRYLAVVAGCPEGTIHFGGSLDVTRKRFGGRAQQQWAGTTVTLLRRSSSAALLECRPQTGRFHQIRQHLAQAGFPILGDTEHAPPGFRWPVASPRLALHSWFLSFQHPKSGLCLSFDSPLPRELERLLA